ncbi:MAG TPA: GNAT family N-acetyltransferase [Polyangiaceae bacterium]|nr:GNAT family N-acetyltransferase [Polyangiaceae bacterium]
METRRIAKADFDHIVEVVDRWWGGPIHAQVHPMFFYELGDHALIVEEGGIIIGFLLGFVALSEVKRNYPPTPGAGVGVKTGYVHLVGIHPEYRRRGVGRLLYKDFIRECTLAGCTRMKAITTPGNEGSIRFHLAVGWQTTEMEDYAGHKRRRIVFTKDVSPENEPAPASGLPAASGAEGSGAGITETGGHRDRN